MFGTTVALARAPEAVKVADGDIAEMAEPGLGLVVDELDAVENRDISARRNSTVMG